MLLHAQKKHVFQLHIFPFQCVNFGPIHNQLILNQFFFSNQLNNLMLLKIEAHVHNMGAFGCKYMVSILIINIIDVLFYFYPFTYKLIFLVKMTTCKCIVYKTW